MQSSFDHRQVSAPGVSPLKRLGGYLVEAGLLTPAQVSVILNDQEATGMRFGEIVVARGWVKEQTIEWIVKKVVEPERHRHQNGHQKETIHSQVLQETGNPHSAHLNQVTYSQSPQSRPTTQSGRSLPLSTPTAEKPYTRRELPIAKPLPSVGPKDGDVNWVG